MSTRVVSVYGYGRFGKIWADILAENFQLKVFSRRGLTREDVSPGIEISDEEGIYDCDVLFFCTAISSFEEVLKRSVRYARRETVFFDTCSVKVYPARWMKEYLPKGSKIIATHPMFGPDSYHHSAEGLPLVLCNISADEKTVEEWSIYFSSKSLRVERMSPDRHDEMTACSQGITHYMGRVLAGLNLNSTRIDTLGYKKILEVVEQTCNDSLQLFCDLQNYNPYSSKMRERMRESIGRVNAALEQENNNSETVSWL
jgi:prephenate dehydrogenase